MNNEDLQKTQSQAIEAVIQDFINMGMTRKEAELAFRKSRILDIVDAAPSELRSVLKGNSRSP